MAGILKKNLMRSTPTLEQQSKMRMCLWCVHSHISDLGYNFCWEGDSARFGDGSPEGICSAFRDNRIWIPCYLSTLTSHYRGNICWAKKIYSKAKNATGKRHILKYEIIDPVANTLATRLPKDFDKEYIIATPGSKPPFTMAEYEKWDVMCFGDSDYIKKLTKAQEARNYAESHWQDILAKEIINKQL